MTLRYGYLQDFFLGYFHPDWQLDAGSRTDVVNDYLASSDHHEVFGVISDLEALLNEPLDEAALHDKVLREFSLFYDPWADGGTMRVWLDALLSELQRDIVK